MGVIAMSSRRSGGARRTRVTQRWVHLVSALVVLVFIYLTPDPDSVFVTVVRWVGFPVLAATGIAMWQWPRIRRLRRLYHERVAA
jgi:thiosulfate reductase cytochrome b subunit